MSEQKVYVIGSAPDCDIVVDEPHVSGRHCKLVLDRGGFLLEDLESTNGTYVNGVRISEATIVTKGERVTLGRKVNMPWPGSPSAESATPSAPAPAAPPVAAPAPPPAAPAPPVAAPAPKPPEKPKPAPPPADPPAAVPIPMTSAEGAASKSGARELPPVPEPPPEPPPAKAAPPAAKKLSPLEMARAQAKGGATDEPKPAPAAGGKPSPLEMARAQAKGDAPAKPKASPPGGGKPSPLEMARAQAKGEAAPAKPKAGGKPSPLDMARAQAKGDAPPAKPKAPKASPPVAKASPPPAKTVAAAPKTPAASPPVAKPVAAKPKGTPPEIKDLPPPSPARPSPRFTDPFALDPNGSPQGGSTMLYVGAGLAVLACLALLYWAFFGSGPQPDESPPKPEDNEAQQSAGEGEAGNDDKVAVKDPGEGEGTDPEVEDPAPPAVEVDPREAVVWLGITLDDTTNRYASGFALSPEVVLTSEKNISWMKSALAGDLGTVLLVGHGDTTVEAANLEVVPVDGSQWGMLKVSIPTMKSLVSVPVTKFPATGTEAELLVWDDWKPENRPNVTSTPLRLGERTAASFAAEFDGEAFSSSKLQGSAVVAGGRLVGMLNYAGDGTPIVQPIPADLP